MSHAKVFTIILSWSVIVAVFVGMIIHIWNHKAHFGAATMTVSLVVLIAVLSKIVSEES